MEINIETHLIINGSKGFRRGGFTVNISDFKKDPDFTAACKAYEFIQWQMRQHCYTTFEIEKVIYDGEHDITELTRKIRPVYDDTWLPF